MSLDGNELDMRAYIERRRSSVSAALTLGRRYLTHARQLYAEGANPDSRRYLVLAIACVETGEAELESLNVEFL